MEQNHITYVITIPELAVSCESRYDDVEKAKSGLIHLASDIVFKKNDPQKDATEGYYWKFANSEGTKIDVYHKLKGFMYDSDVKIAICGISRLASDATEDVEDETIETPKAFEHGSHVAYITELKDLLRRYTPPTVESIEQRLESAKIANRSKN